MDLDNYLGKGKKKAQNEFGLLIYYMSRPEIS